MHSIVLNFCFCVSFLFFFAFTLFLPLVSPFNFFHLFKFCYNFPLFSPLFQYSLLLWSCSRLSLVLSFPFIVFHSCSSVSFIFLLIVFPFYLVSLTCLNLSFSVSPTLYSILILFSLVHSFISFPASYPISTSVWFISFSTFDLLLPLFLYLCLFVFLLILCERQRGIRWNRRSQPKRGSPTMKHALRPASSAYLLIWFVFFNFVENHLHEYRFYTPLICSAEPQSFAS